VSRETTRPFLITKDEAGSFRLTIRDTHSNSQGYPIVTATLHDQLFVTATAAKLFARENFNAQNGQFATK
jgi:hypothetical protein